MAPRSRLLAFGSAAALVVAGAICAIAGASTAVNAAAVALITFGLGWAFLLVFYEVGLSEDHARAREAEERRRSIADPARRPARRPRSRWRRRPE